VIQRDLDFRKRPTDDVERYEDDTARICGVDHPSVNTWNTSNTYQPGLPLGPVKPTIQAIRTKLKRLINSMDVFLTNEFNPMAYLGSCVDLTYQP
jgi:hypothetical protein